MIPFEKIKSSIHLITQTWDIYFVHASFFLYFACHFMYRASDSCLLLDYVHVINFVLLLLLSSLKRSSVKIYLHNSLLGFSIPLDTLQVISETLPSQSLDRCKNMVFLIDCLAGTSQPTVAAIKLQCKNPNNTYN